MKLSGNALFLQIVLLVAGLIGAVDPILAADRAQPTPEHAKQKYVNASKQPYCQLSQSDVDKYLIINRNTDGFLDVPPCYAAPGLKKINLSGIANYDSKYASHGRNKTSFYGTGRRGELAINAADIFADVAFFRWLDAHVALNYHTLQDRLPVPSTNEFLTGPDGARRVNVEEGFFTVGDVTRFPLYARLGKQYVYFGDYIIHPITESLTQLLTQSNDWSATGGLITDPGFYAAGYLESGTAQLNQAGMETDNRVNNYGGQIGFHKIDYGLGYNVNVDYMRNLAQTQYVRGVLRQRNGVAGFRNEVDGINVSASINAGPFDGKVDYVTSLEAFNRRDVSYRGRGAEPWAFGIEAGYAFLAGFHPSRLRVGYQTSGQASGLFFPRYRYLAGYEINLHKHIDVGAELIYQQDFSKGSGGSGRNAFIGSIRVRWALA